MVEPDSNPGTILVVDDEPNNFDVIEAFLCRDGYEFHYAASGRVVLQQLSVFQPDVILLDVMMPDLDGLEVCRQIKADPAWNHIRPRRLPIHPTRKAICSCSDHHGDGTRQQRGFVSLPRDGS